jgi:hypothetical protein
VCRKCSPRGDVVGGVCRKKEVGSKHQRKNKKESSKFQVQEQEDIEQHKSFFYEPVADKQII